jgi:hypothetical protein
MLAVSAGEAVRIGPLAESGIAWGIVVLPEIPMP